MNLLRLLSAAVVLSALPTPAAVDISGTTTYTQDFDSLPSASALQEFTWTDDVTIPGFFLHRTNAPAGQVNLAGSLFVAGSRPYIDDGSLPPTSPPNHHGFLSLGTFLSGEQSLGFSPTTQDGATNWCGGTLSVIGAFTNTTGGDLVLIGISYDLEAWRPNTSATNSETITLTHKVGPADLLLTELGAPTASPTFTQTGYDIVNAALNFTTPDGFTALSASASRSITLSAPTEIHIPSGETLVLRWGNVNEHGAIAMFCI